jgi:hypothetical protein
MEIQLRRWLQSVCLLLPRSLTAYNPSPAPAVLTHAHLFSYGKCLLVVDCLLVMHLQRKAELTRTQ